jgi:yecA family protein
MGMEPRRRVGSVTEAFTYAELDEILRGTGHSGAIGMSAIDGLIAALVAAPSFVHPDEWVPLIFGSRQPPLHENSPELRAVKTIFNRYNEVSETLADQPSAYRPIFMIDDNGGIVARDWAVGFVLGIGLHPKEWGKCILLTKHREVLLPILVYCEDNLDLLPEMPVTERRRRQATAHEQIAPAVSPPAISAIPTVPQKLPASPAKAAEPPPARVDNRHGAAANRQASTTKPNRGFSSVGLAMKDRSIEPDGLNRN